jgi:hypothetical protein
MQPMMRTAIAALALAALPALALARGGGSGHGGTFNGGGAGGRGGGVPPCQQAVTSVPWGTTDSSCVGGPPGRSGWTGGIGGPDMRISEQGHKNWPNFPAPVAGHGWVAGGNAPITSQPPR